METVIVWGVTVTVAFGLIGAAVEDGRTHRVSVSRSRVLTIFAIAGFSTVAVATGDWGLLIAAAIGASFAVGIQSLPLLLQVSGEERVLGKADIRLAVPFGWALGWHGVSFVFIGLTMSVAGGLLVLAVLRANRIPFIPFLAGGYVASLVWKLTTVS